MTPEPAVVTSGLSKSYRIGFLARRRRVALEPLDLTVGRGEIFGYLGPNGSGKTTTLKILMGLMSADSGTASILGTPLADRSWTRRVGFLPEHPYLYDYLTAEEYLEYSGRLFGMPRFLRKERIRELLERVGLLRSAGLSLRRFSKGMVQRAGLAQALINDPELVLLDEPMSGLDPLGRRLVRNIILELKEQGKTVFFSTHILSDAETLCDRVALLRSGRLVAVGGLQEILKVDVAHLEVLVTGVDEHTVSQFPTQVRFKPVGERLCLEVPEAALGVIITAVEGAGGRILAVQPVRQSLEEYFVREMGLGQEEPWTLQD